MRKKYRVMLTDAAQEDLESIVAYIAKELREPAAARRTYAKIMAEIKKLDVMPERHALAADTYLQSRGVRPFYVANYVAPYEIIFEEGAVRVLRVLHVRRDWGRLL